MHHIGSNFIGLLALRFLTLSFFLRSSAIVLLVALVAVYFYFAPTAPTISVVSAVSEFVSFTAVESELTPIRLDGYAITYVPTPPLTAPTTPHDKAQLAKAGKAPLCLTGTLLPAPGTRVAYHRTGEGNLVVTLKSEAQKPAAIFRAVANAAKNAPRAPDSLQTSTAIKLEAHTAAAADDSDDDTTFPCKGKPQLRLAIYGPAKIGTRIHASGVEDNETSEILLSGTIDLFAKTLELKTLNDGLTSLYPTSITGMNLPPGVEVSEHVTGEGKLANWVGYASANSDGALDVHVTTSAPFVQLLRSGADKKPDVLGIDMFAQLANDPMILALQVFAVLAFSALHGAGSFLKRKDERKEAGVEADSG